MMADRPSKEERKRMRRQAEDDLRQAVVHCGVISPKATPAVLTPEAILADAQRIGVNLLHVPLGDDCHAFGVPGGPDEFCVTVSFALLDSDFFDMVKDNEWLMEDRAQLTEGMPICLFKGKMHLDPAVDFLGMTVKRVLGRLAGGVFVDESVVMDDWLSWSLDYMDPDMFKITRIYDTDCPDFTQLIERFPKLRCQRDGRPNKKSWWRFW
jgi:hypothetical protein